MIFDEIKKKINDRIIKIDKDMSISFLETMAIKTTLYWIRSEIEKEEKIMNCMHCKTELYCSSRLSKHLNTLNQPLNYCSKWKNKNEK